MKPKMPFQDYHLGERVRLNLNLLNWTGQSLRSVLLRRYVRNCYQAYKVKKLSARMKTIVKCNLTFLDNVKFVYIIGANAHAQLLMEMNSAHNCYIDGTYSGLGWWRYDVVISDGRLQQRLSNLDLEDIAKYKLLNKANESSP